MNASSVVARVLSKYVDCRHRQGPVCEQKMADLLVDSLTDHPLSALIFNPLVWVKLQRRLGRLYLHVPKEGFFVATQVETSAKSYRQFFENDDPKNICPCFIADKNGHRLAKI